MQKGQLYLEGFSKSQVQGVSLDIANGGQIPFTYTVECDAKWLILSQRKAEVTIKDQLLLTLDREELEWKERDTDCTFVYKTDFAR